jgi:[protein-PII] uridylyltransferase
VNYLIDTNVISEVQKGDRCDAHVAAWLVRNHLLMSSTAQRKDISDPLVINEFANKVGDKMHLDYIYLLTVADMRATNPNIYNAWKASLLEDLYHATKNALQRGLNNPLVRQERINDNRRAAQELLLKRGWKKEKIETFWTTVGNNYFLRHHPEEICWHVHEIFCALEGGNPRSPTPSRARRAGGEQEHPSR